MNKFMFALFTCIFGLLSSSGAHGQKVVKTISFTKLLNVENILIENTIRLEIYNFLCGYSGIILGSSSWYPIALPFVVQNITNAVDECIEYVICANNTRTQREWVIVVDDYHGTKYFNTINIQIDGSKVTMNMQVVTVVFEYMMFWVLLDFVLATIVLLCVVLIANSECWKKSGTYKNVQIGN